MFYPAEEFEAQMTALIAQGYPEDLARDQVLAQESRDEEEYNQWRDEQDEIARQEEMYAEHNDSWYEDQYDLDFADF